MGWMPVANEPIKLNGAVHTLYTIIKFVAASEVEANQVKRKQVNVQYHPGQENLLGD